MHFFFVQMPHETFKKPSAVKVFKKSKYRHVDMKNGTLVMM